MGYEVVLSVFSCSLHQDNEASVWLIAIFDINLTRLHQLLNPLSRWPLWLNLINTQQYSVLPLQCPTTVMMNNVKLRLICQIKHKIIQYSTLSKSNQNSKLITMFFFFLPTFYIIAFFSWMKRISMLIACLLMANNAKANKAGDFFFQKCLWEKVWQLAGALFLNFFYFSSHGQNISIRNM